MRVEQVSPKEKKVLQLLCELSEKEKIVLLYRFCDRKTQAEVGKILNLTTERVRQIENKGVGKIRKLEKNRRFFNK